MIELALLIVALIAGFWLINVRLIEINDNLDRLDSSLAKIEAVIDNLDEMADKIVKSERI
jgi:hypothetical protein